MVNLVVGVIFENYNNAIEEVLNNESMRERQLAAKELVEKASTVELKKTNVEYVEQKTKRKLL